MFWSSAACVQLLSVCKPVHVFTFSLSNLQPVSPPACVPVLLREPGGPQPGEAERGPGGRPAAQLSADAEGPR